MNLVRRIALALLAAALVTLTALPALAKLEDKDWSKARRDLDAGLAANGGNGDPNAISQAVAAIGQDQSKRAVELLVTLGAKLEDITIYDAVKAALSSMTEPEAVNAMINQLKSQSGGDQWTTRCVLVDCMSTVKGEGITAAIVKALDDPIPYVTSAAAKSLGKRRDKEGVDPLIKKLAKLEKSKDVVWVDVKQALTDITGWDKSDAKEWASEWEARGKDFDPEKDRGKETSATTVRPGEESGSFFSEPIVAKRIMFVIDISGSMAEKDIPIEGKGKQTRIQVVKDELIRCVKTLKKDVKFNIIAFSQSKPPKMWSKPQGGSAIVPANEANRADAMKWVSMLKEGGGTETEEALKEAFKAVEINQIVLLSDGAPTKGEALANTDELLKVVKGLNRLRGVKINSFCFAVFQTNGMQQLLTFMEALATQNGGKLTLVGGGGAPKPPPGGAGGGQGGNP